MRNIFLSAVALLTLLTCCTTQPKEQPADYVTVRDGKFWVGEQEYRYVGTNFWYGAILGSEGRGGNRQRLTEELDLMQEVGINNVRVLVGGDGREGIPSHISPKLQLEPGVYNDTLLQGLDYMMAELERRGMKAVLYMNNAWEWSGGYGAYLDWVGFEGDVYSSDDKGTPGPDGRLTKHFDHTPVPSYDGWWEYMQYVGNFVLNDSARALAANHVRYIVSRTNTVTGRPYSESPALMAWEIANEPRCFGTDSLHKARFVEWIDQQSALIKSIDPNHLVTTGSEGRNGCEEDMELFDRIHSLPNIDYACIHIWPNNWGWLGKFNQNYDADKTIAADQPDPIVDCVEVACQKTLEYIDEAYSYTQKTGRPLVLEEFGYPRDRFVFTPGSPTRGRDAYYKYVFQIIRDSGKIAGCNFWGWGGKAQVKNVIWQPYDDYVCDPAQEEQGLNSVFACDTTTLDMIREMNQGTLQCSLTANDEDWVWSTGDDIQLDLTLSNTFGAATHCDSLEIVITSDTRDREFFRKVIKPFALDKEHPLTEHVDVQGEMEQQPGFYHLTVLADGANIVKNPTKVWSGELVIDHYTLGVDPEKIISEPDGQDDLEAFWDKARTQLAATPMKPRVRELKEQSNGQKRAYIADIQGLDGANVEVYYTVPVKEGKYPVHIINMGYSSKPWQLDMQDNGWIDVIVSSRGQGANSDSNPYGDWVQYGLQSPETYYYRGAYLDCPRAIDYLVTVPEVDAQNIFLEGGSQGGAYSMACAALDHRVRAVAVYITFMSDFPDYFRIVNWPAQPIKAKQQELGISDEELMKTLSYFDIKNLAGWIECPVYMAIGLQDVTCPPHTNFSGYNQVKTEKQYRVFRQYGHHVDYDVWNPTLHEWYDKFRH